MQNINEKSVIFLPDLRLLLTELNQSRFTHTAGRYNNHIVSVRDRLYQASRFLYTITKIFRFNFTGYDKGIYNFCHILDLFSKYNYLIRIIQIE